MTQNHYKHKLSFNNRPCYIIFFLYQKNIMKHTLFSLIILTAMNNIHAIDMPQTATLQYSGSYGIPAIMTFKRSGNNYTVAANINVPLYKIRFESGGTIIGNQLKPSYYRDVRNGKIYASARFSGNKATYGRTGETQTETISGSVMDLFTLSWQLAFSNGKLPADLKITNGKKIYRFNNLRNIGSKNVQINGSNTTINQLTLKRGDDTVYYAFAPTLNNVPAIIHYNDGGKNYKLTLKSVNINGKNIKP